VNIYQVIFKENGKPYLFNGNELKIPNNVTVIVDTENGLQFAKVISKIESFENIDVDNLKNVVRISTKKDYEQYLKNTKDAKEALEKAREICASYNTDMNFVDAEFNFERKQLLFKFVAPERVDFRDIAKELAKIYHTRIELRQIGARDKATLVGGLGVCGRELCCSKFLNRIDSVSISMAKDQNLALNPTKINGVCGRLLCCLSYENQCYLECSKNMPYVGKTVKTIYGDGVVKSIDILNRKYNVLVNDDIKEIFLDEK
jgi:cell fate regulator YaaT (PSP1 superfamily)